ncbi:hypothetical protein NL676_039549 [Syzygium grande]|nr:hypothetical protein NL676_039549 [Syzygium grande]
MVASNVATTMRLLCMVSCQFLFSLRQPNGSIAGGGSSRNPLLRISILEPASNLAFGGWIQSRRPRLCSDYYQENFRHQASPEKRLLVWMLSRAWGI